MHMEKTFHRPGTLLFIFAAFTSNTAQADGVGGFDKLHWGMTKAEVRSNYASVEEWDENKINPFTNEPTINHVVGLREYYRGGCEYKLILEFANNSLELIGLEHKTEHSESCQNDVRQALFANYGNSPKSVSNAYDTTLTWNSPVTTVIFREDASGNSFGVSYSHTGAIEKFFMDQIKSKDKY